MSNLLNAEELENKLVISCTVLGNTQDGVQTLEVTICNRSGEDLLLGNAEITGDFGMDMPPLLDDEYLEANHTRSFTFFLTANHSDQDSKTLHGIVSGTCHTVNGNVLLGTWKSDFYKSILPRKLNASFRLVRAYAKPQQIVLGESTMLHLEFENTGEADLKELTLPTMQLRYTRANCGFNAARLLKGHTYTKRIPIKPTESGEIVYEFAGQNVSGISQGNKVFGTGVKTAMVLVVPR